MTEVTEMPDDKPYGEIIEKNFAFLFRLGFSYEYLYDKGSDSSCVYIYRFKRGRDFVDFRVTSGGGEGNFVVCSGGNYYFPNLKTRHKKLFRAFALKHVFRKPTKEELWKLAAQAAEEEAKNGLFGLVPTEE